MLRQIFGDMSSGQLRELRRSYRQITHVPLASLTCDLAIVNAALLRAEVREAWLWTRFAAMWISKPQAATRPGKKKGE